MQDNLLINPVKQVLEIGLVGEKYLIWEKLYLRDSCSF